MKKRAFNGGGSPPPMAAPMTGATPGGSAPGAIGTPTMGAPPPKPPPPAPPVVAPPPAPGTTMRSAMPAPTMNMKMGSNYQPKAKLEAEDKDKLDPVITGAALLGGGAALVGSKPLVTGRTRLYHGATREAVDKIRQEGLRPKVDIPGPGITDVLPDDVKGPSQKYVFFTPSKAEARSYAGQAEFLRRANKPAAEAIKDPLAREIEMIAAYVNPTVPVVEADVPLWRKEFQDRLRANPETRGSFEAFQASEGASGNNVYDRAVYDSLNSAKVFEGAVGPEYIRGAKFKGITPSEILEYAKARPGRFAGGVALGLGGLGLLGYGGYRAYRHFRPRRQEQQVVKQAQDAVYAHFGLL